MDILVKLWILVQCIFHKDVVTSYSRAFMKDAESFWNTILDQPLWGNGFINVQKRGEKNIMLLRNWIRSGVRYINDLSFVNGIVDRSVCNAIVDKQNIHIEYSCIRKALVPYANNIIRAQNQNSSTTYEPKVLKAKFKPYYKDFICNNLTELLNCYILQFGWRCELTTL